MLVTNISAKEHHAKHAWWEKQTDEKEKGFIKTQQLTLAVSPSTSRGVIDATCARRGPYSINCFRFRWMIVSCTAPIVIFRRFVSVAFVK